MNIITGSIFKPDRILYYIEPTAEEKDFFYHGIMPAALMDYIGAFGTYNYPELYKFKKDGVPDEVIGIEFRPDDDRVTYPQGLKSLRIDKSFMISIVYTEDEFLDDARVSEGINYVIENIESHSCMEIIRPEEEPEIVQISTYGDRYCCLIQAEEVSPAAFFREVQPVTSNEKVLYERAYVDQITGHYNWNYLWPRIAGYGFCGIQDFMFVHFDVKDFKAINVVYGHDVANNLLLKISATILRQDWIYFSGRCDNDNFALMIKDMPEDECREKLSRMFATMEVLEEDPNYHVYFRCGVVPMRNALTLGDTVADAGKQVQRMGSKLYETEILFYTDKMQDNIDWSIKIKSYLDTAIANDEFLVYFQPKYDIHDEKIHGAEALIRWMYHGKQLLSPGRFVPVLEVGGLISKLDDIVLHKVCRAIKRWSEEGKPLYPVSVNLSRKRLGNPDIVNYLTGIVDTYGIPHELIDFEVTESAAHDDEKCMINIIRGLKARGFKISMDDFGTGYSSLALLTILPMDTLKIDKSFVDGIASGDDNSKSCTLIRHIINMSKDLKFTCLAEGAEEKEQVDRLREFGCEFVQGYYYSKPLPQAEYEKLL